MNRAVRAEPLLPLVLLQDSLPAILLPAVSPSDNPIAAGKAKTGIKSVSANSISG